ncbi:MAG TPA: amino acid ABC transporter permease [Polyangia bacterium]|nr:amino acid ABC transporter permease [Polyangia bacterium]
MDFSVVKDNLTYFLIGRFPHGPLGGVALTLILAVVSLVLSLFGGLILGLCSVSRRRWVRWPSAVFINTVRGMPLLMVIFWAYFLWPALLGHPTAESQTVVLSLTVFTSAYMSQIVRAGIAAVPRGQTEAAVAAGLSPHQTLWRVVLPQALRNMIPSFVNQFVSMIKDTSLAFIVGVDELTHVATQVNNRTLTHPTEIFLFVAVVYFAMCYAFTALSRWLERRLVWRRSI